MKRSCGFTLIELLVVISIVVLLIAILLPTLRQAREAGKTMLCLSNQRQVRLVLQAYADDNDGYPPPQSDGSVTWTVHAIRYLRNTSQQDAYYPYLWGPSPREDHDPVMFCPTLSAMGYSGSAVGTGRAPWYTNYCSNGWIMGNPAAQPGQLYAMRRLHAFGNSATVAMLWDAAPWDATSDRAPWAAARYHFMSLNPNMAVGYPHGGQMREFFNLRNGSANVLYIDGHAAAQRDPGDGGYLDIYYSPTTGYIAPD